MSLRQLTLATQNNTEMGWVQILSYFTSFARTNTLKLQIRSLGKIAGPIIDNLEKMLGQLEVNNPSLSGESKAQNDFQFILPHIRGMLKRGKAILESVNYEVYYVANESEAKNIRSHHAVVFFKNNRQHLQARLVDISKHKDIIIAVPTTQAAQCDALKTTLLKNAELVITDQNIQSAEELIKTLMQVASIDSPIKTFNEFMSSVISFSQDLPKFIELLEQSSSIPLINQLLKNVLPIEKYRSFCKKILIELKPENFEKRLLVEKLAALALMEAYNNGLKLVVVALDKIEIQNNFPPFSLSEKYAVIDGMTIKGLCEEFNDAYHSAMQVSGYTIQTEIYPYKASIFKQCQTMLGKLSAETKDERVQIQRQRIENRILALGEIKECPQLIDFYSFVKNFLKSNKTNLMEAINVLSPQTVTITQTSKNIILNLEKQLKEILDEKIYETYFINKAVEEEKPSWIYQAGNVFIHIKEILKKIETLLNPQVAGNHTPFASIELMVSVMRELSQSTAQLLLALDGLYKNPKLQQIVVLPTWTDIDPNGTLKKAGVVAMTGGDVLAAIKTSGDSMIQNMKKLETFLETHAESNIPDTQLRKRTLASYRNIIEIVTKLNLLYREIEQESHDKITLVKFVISHYSKILKILNGLPDILTTISELSKNQFQSIVSAINDILKALMLFSDKIEIQFYLKEGYIAHRWHKYIFLFQLTVMKLGYDFRAEKRYPYIQEINAQREQLGSSDTSIPGRQITTARIQGSSIPVLDEKKHDHGPDKVGVITEAIKLHITKLEALKHLKNNAIVIQLLTEMQNSVENDSTIEKLLQDVRVKHAKEVHLLYEGGAGKLLQKLEYIDLRPKDSWHAFQMKLAELKKQRGVTHYFFSKKKARTLEERINACEHLYNLAMKYNLGDALAKLSKDEKAILMKYDATLIKQLRWIDQATPPEFRNKTMIDAENKDDQVEVGEVKRDLPEKKEDTSLFWNRIVELNFSIFQTKTNKKKIELLTKLDEELGHGAALDVAIKRVKRNMPEDAHLLFEGCTGKAIKAAQNALVTKDELILRIDAEINALKEKRYIHLRFFARIRKSIVDNNIKELINLKDSIIRSPKVSVQEIIHELSNNNQAVLKKYEPDLYQFAAQPNIKTT